MYWLEEAQTLRIAVECSNFITLFIGKFFIGRLFTGRLQPHGIMSDNPRHIVLHSLRCYLLLADSVSVFLQVAEAHVSRSVPI